MIQWNFNSSRLSRLGLRENIKIKGKKTEKKHRHFCFIPPRAETTTSPARRKTATSRPSGATCAATAAASTDWIRRTGQRCTGQQSTTTRRSWRSSWRRAPPWTSLAAEAVGSSAIAAGHGAASATPPVLRCHSAALCSNLRPRGVRPAAAGSKGLRGQQGHQRLGASADVPFLNTFFFTGNHNNRYNKLDITGAVQRMWRVSMTYDTSFKFFQLQQEISLDLSSQVPVFKVALKFNSRDFGACVC